jgi:NTP pyrophosphatase (non-canonical NTP hydrolase)
LITNTDPQVNPWKPVTDELQLKLLGKLLEELGEAVSAVSRCIIQGVDESHPVTKKHNKEWLTEEIADVFASAEHTIAKLKLDRNLINKRFYEKSVHLEKWHRM